MIPSTLTFILRRKCQIEQYHLMRKKYVITVGKLGLMISWVIYSALNVLIKLLAIQSLVIDVGIILVYVVLRLAPIRGRREMNKMSQGLNSKLQLQCHLCGWYYTEEKEHSVIACEDILLKRVAQLQEHLVTTERLRERASLARQKASDR